MRAVGFETSLPIADERSLVDLDLPVPEPRGRDLLVEVCAVSVNPVDTKMRMRTKPEPGKPQVLGYDAAGVVKAAGPRASLFKPGDAVFYAGAINRPGTNSEFHLVDERIVGRKPSTLDFPQAAALPLTSITAWETLSDRLDVRRPVPGAPRAILIIGGAGGVGSIAIQLAGVFGLQAIATASRAETRDWCKAMGAAWLVDHSEPLSPQVRALGLGAPGFVFSTTQTDRHLSDIADLIAPQGRFAVIDDPAALDLLPFKRKSVSAHWEFMFTRPVFETADIAAQGELLNQVSALVDEGRVRTTWTQTLGPIDAPTLRRAHALIESGRSIGKLVLAGF